MGVTSTALTLKIKITNTTPASFTSDVHAFGAAVDPNVTAAFASGGQGTVFDGISAGAGAQQTFPGGFKNIDFCALSAANCSGGASGDGLLNGISDTITVVLSGVFGVNPILLSLFPIKFQTGLTPDGSFEPGGVVSAVPLPAGLALLMTALGALGFVGRRRKVAALAA